MDIFSKTVIQTHGRNYEKGEVIFSEGDRCHEMFIINTGSVQILKQMHGQNVCLSTLGPGEFIGEMEDGSRPRNVSAVAQSSCNLVVMESGTFFSLVNDNPQLAWRIIKKLNRRIRTMNEKLLKALTKDDGSKLAQALVAWQDDPQHTEVIDEKSVAFSAGILPSAAFAMMTHLEKCDVLTPCGRGKWKVKDDNALKEFDEYCIRKSQMDPLYMEELAKLAGMQSHEARVLAIRAIEKRLASSSPDSAGKKLMTPLQRYLKLKLRFELHQDRVEGKNVQQEMVT